VRLLTYFLSLALLFGGVEARADACPDSYRFVDFGLQDQQGSFLRGGPLYRAVDLSNRALLKTEKTVCRAVPALSTDGHGIPIPVVTHVVYDTQKMDFDLSLLAVSFADDARDKASQNAQTHREQISASLGKQFTGPDSLCLLSEDGLFISCQLVSPYPGNSDLVVYCDAESCRMPVLAVAPQIFISASWDGTARHLVAPENAGSALLERARSIKALLDPLTSGG